MGSLVADVALSRPLPHWYPSPGAHFPQKAHIWTSMTDPKPIGRAIEFELKGGSTYLGVACKSCGVPVAVAILDGGVRPPLPLLGTSFQIACGDAACLAQHIYGPADICQFRWPGRK